MPTNNPHPTIEHLLDDQATPVIKQIPTSEYTWIKAAQNGDDDAFRLLMEKHQDRIFQLCLRMLSCKEDAAEACQDTFIRAHRALPKFTPNVQLFTWLYQIALNRCRDSWKRAAVKLLKLSDPISNSHSHLTCPNPQPTSKASSNEDILSLEKALQSLPSKHREILILHSIEGLTYHQCAAALDISTRAVEGRIYRARTALNASWEKFKKY